jgi:uncharacterized protein YqhQ
VSEARVPQQAVGGQAVIEGVVMRTPSGLAIAVRKADGRIVVRDKPWRPLSRRFPVLGWPLIRGVVVLIESLREGIDALRFSAETAVGEEGVEGTDRGSSGFSANMALLLGAVLALVIFKGVPHVLALWIGLDPTQTLFHVVDGAIKLVLIVGYIAAISRMKDIQRVFQYHGAEHKSIRAFEAGAELTVAETVPFSRLHERCGTSFIVVVVGASILVYIALSPLIPRDTGGGVLFQVVLILAKILLLGPVAAIAYEINRLAGKYWRSPLARLVAWPGLLMQRLLTTREPSADQIEVALTALRAALAFGPDDAGGARDPGWRLREFASFEKFVAEDGGEPRVAPGRSEAA